MSTLYLKTGNDCTLQQFDEINEPKQAKHEHSRKAGVFIWYVNLRKQMFTKRCIIKNEPYSWPKGHTITKNPGTTWKF
jgi:hypothetical protein